MTSCNKCAAQRDSGDDSRSKITEGNNALKHVVFGEITHVALLVCLLFSVHVSSYAPIFKYRRFETVYTRCSTIQILVLFTNSLNLYLFSFFLSFHFYFHFYRRCSFKKVSLESVLFLLAFLQISTLLLQRATCAFPDTKSWHKFSPLYGETQGSL